LRYGSVIYRREWTMVMGKIEENGKKGPEKGGVLEMPLYGP
jgi:hypothetical protein